MSHTDEAHHDWLRERPPMPRDDADYSPPPNPYTSCADGDCWHRAHDEPCPDFRWCLYCLTALYPDEPIGGPCHRCLDDKHDERRKDWNT